MKKQLLLLVMMLLPMCASAHDIEVLNGEVTMYYNYISEGTELEVTSGDTKYVGIVVIPKEVTYMNNTYKVTSISDSAFYDCPKLISITIPNSLTRIGCNAFQNCLGLNKVIVSDIAAWCGINFGNYSANPLYHAGHLYRNENAEIKDLVIPNSVTSISSRAFGNCTGLTSVTIPNSVTSIGEYNQEIKGETNVEIIPVIA